MNDDSINFKKLAHHVADRSGMPEVVDRATFQAKLENLRVREKAHTREGDANIKTHFPDTRILLSHGSRHEYKGIRDWRH